MSLDTSSAGIKKAHILLQTHQVVQYIKDMVIIVTMAILIKQTELPEATRIIIPRLTNIMRITSIFQVVLPKLL